MNFRQWLVIKSYQKGNISLGKLAEILSITLEESKSILNQVGVPIDIGVNSTEELRTDIENA